MERRAEKRVSPRSGSCATCRRTSGSIATYADEIPFPTQTNARPTARPPAATVRPLRVQISPSSSTSPIVGLRPSHGGYHFALGVPAARSRDPMLARSALMCRGFEEGVHAGDVRGQLFRNAVPLDDVFGRIEGE